MAHRRARVIDPPVDNGALDTIYEVAYKYARELRAFIRR